MCDANPLSETAKATLLFMSPPPPPIPPSPQPIYQHFSLDMLSAPESRRVRGDASFLGLKAGTRGPGAVRRDSPRELGGSAREERTAHLPTCHRGKETLSRFTGDDWCLSLSPSPSLSLSRLLALASSAHISLSLSLPHPPLAPSSTSPPPPPPPHPKCQKS